MWGAEMMYAAYQVSKIVFFFDTGLLCQLLRIQNVDQLSIHPLRGAVFENYVIAECTKINFNRGVDSLLNEKGIVQFLNNAGAKLSQGSDIDGASFLEFNYMILQSYDFLHLHRTLGVSVQIGGDDQWSNMIGGMDLIRRKERKQAFIITNPLLATSSGVKIGKTEKGAVWLDPKMTSPYDLFQYFRNVDDDMVEKCLFYFTDLPVEEVHRLGGLEQTADVATSDKDAVTNENSGGDFAADVDADASHPDKPNNDTPKVQDKIQAPLPISTAVDALVSTYILPSYCKDFAAVEEMKPIAISDAAGLAAIENGKSYILTTDIVLPAGWTRPYTKKRTETIIIDGRGHKLKNLMIDKAAENDGAVAYAGLFPELYCSRIENLTIDHPQMNVTTDGMNSLGIIQAGAIGGGIYHSVLRNVEVTDVNFKFVARESHQIFAGAFAGTLTSSWISNSRSNGVQTFDGRAKSGGLVGVLGGSFRISDSATNVSISSMDSGGLKYFGGIVGSLNGSGEITRVQSLGLIKVTDVDGTSSAVGGLVGSIGLLQAQDKPLISDSLFAGTMFITNSQGVNAGGIIGSVFSALSIDMKRIIAYGTFDDAHGVALVGHSSSELLTIDSFYWSTELSGVSNLLPSNNTSAGLSAGATNLSTTNAKKADSYVGFDFSKVWTMSPNTGLPILRARN
jgi:hypothetical protein